MKQLKNYFVHLPFNIISPFIDPDFQISFVSTKIQFNFKLKRKCTQNGCDIKTAYNHKITQSYQRNNVTQLTEKQVLQCRKKAPEPYTKVQPCLLFDLKPSLLLSSSLFDVVFFMCIAAICMCVAEYGARPARCS